MYRAVRRLSGRRRRGHSAILLEPYHAVYVTVPKAACSSIKVALAGLLGIDLEPVGGDPHKVEFPAPPLPWGESTFYPGLFTFAFVRNPWDRLVSCYRDKILGEVHDFTRLHPTRGIANSFARYEAFRAGMSFPEFVKAVAEISDDEADGHFRSQHRFVTNAKGNIAADFVGRFETLADDFARVAKTLGLPDVTLPRVQAARTPRRYADFYTRETRLIVADRFRKDITLFEYEFQGP
jgi:hypothetical protein